MKGLRKQQVLSMIIILIIVSIVILCMVLIAKNKKVADDKKDLQLYRTEKEYAEAVEKGESLGDFEIPENITAEYDRSDMYKQRLCGPVGLYPFDNYKAYVSYEGNYMMYEKAAGECRAEIYIDGNILDIYGADNRVVLKNRDVVYEADGDVSSLAEYIEKLLPGYELLGSTVVPEFDSIEVEQGKGQCDVIKCVKGTETHYLKCAANIFTEDEIEKNGKKLLIKINRIERVNLKGFTSGEKVGYDTILKLIDCKIDF